MAPDIDSATKATRLLRSLGHAPMETWVVTPWQRFKDVAKGLKG